MTFDVTEQKTPELPKTIGPYRVVKNLGRGGMGEVYLAIDPVVGRKVAIKRIRPELQNNKTIRRRFLREAKVASLLTHPSIIPIFEIQIEPPEIYYTMPYVEGETLRQILQGAKEQEKKGGPISSTLGSIPALSRIFLQVCEAVAYTHSKGILHRDLKPENIIVGKFGEVLILDWGIADFIDNLYKDEALPEVPETGPEDLTRPGKITGTLAYMAPERLKGSSSSVQTDLYSLGVILYQILTLQLPFHRKSIALFRKLVDGEQLTQPIDAAPTRDIPHQLAAICTKCLEKSPADRFQTVEELILEMKKSIEGRPEWILAGELDLQREENWLFQENVLLAKHLAISRNFDATKWAAISISEKAFADQLRIDLKIRIAPKSQGIGFLLNMRAPGEVENFLAEGYLLWIGSENHPSCKLFRSQSLVLELPKLVLTPEWHLLRIEKTESHLKFSLDGELKFAFVSHLPLPGKHIGIQAFDDHFEIQSCKVYDGSHNVTVGCLAVADAFLSHRLFDLALEEYRRIGQGFPGRMEGREALFRAGITLLEKGKSKTSLEERDKLFHLALKEFEKLYRTPGAPLEYLGKSFVYAAMGDAEEEAKCLELALRKFPKHPLLPVLKEHIVYRMHESSLNNREAAYRIILLAIRHIPELLQNPDTRELLESLKKNWEPLPFIEEDKQSLTELAIQLSFWLAKIPILVEIANHLVKETPIPEASLCNALYALLELEAISDAEAIFKRIPKNGLSSKRRKSLEIAFSGNVTKATSASCDPRALFYLLKHSLRNETPAKTLKLLHSFDISLPAFSALQLLTLLLDRNWAEAAKLLEKLPAKELHRENSPLHFPYGCFLYVTKNPEAAFQHFGAVLDTPYPPTTALPSHFLTGRIDEKKGWIQQAFWWEKKELYRQIDLFYKIIGKHAKK
jgi:serine/threonine-protein kinase